MAERGSFFSTAAVHGAGAGAPGHGDGRAGVFRPRGRGAAVYLPSDADLVLWAGVFISGRRYQTTKKRHCSVLEINYTYCLKMGNVCVFKQC